MQRPEYQGVTRNVHDKIIESLAANVAKAIDNDILAGLVRGDSEITIAGRVKHETKS